MVDVIGVADVMAKTQQIADGCQHIINDDMLRNQIILGSLDVVNQLVLALALGLCIFQQLLEHFKANLFLNAALLLRVKGNEVLHVNHAVAEYLDLGAVICFDDGAVYAAACNFICQLAGTQRAFLCNDFAGHRIGDGLAQRVACQTACNVQLLVILVTTYRRNVIAAGVKEQRIEQAARRIHRWRLARTQLLINLNQCFLNGLGRILVQRCENALVLTEHLNNLCIGLYADCADERGDRNFSILINADIEYIVAVGLVLEPSAAVRDNRCGQQRLVGLVQRHAVVYARGTDDLRYDNTLCAVDNEGAGICHLREVTHEQLLLLDFACLAVTQTHANAQRASVRCIARLALLYAVFRLVIELIVDERQFQIACIVGDACDVLKDLAQTIGQEPFVGFFLNLDQVRHFQNFRNSGKALSGGASILHIMNVYAIDRCFICHIVPITPFLKYSIRPAA